ncbi:hypothetical protein FE697_006290 [Mumia zhuanghuii]|uniref:Cellulose synthase n=2 Tax=Mumia TaxID=1546255 RepID=A0ABW1QR35_9ACTN|nr:MULTISPECIES: hypothetical protein [Mumia]KAA1423233.1 hypothetical protein FE697_006290 [Mumia zhuanghuii]
MNDVMLLPWAVILSALALFFAWRASRAGDRAAVVRRLGWALVPWALWMVGALRLVVRIADAVADWAAGFVFRPSVWLGIVVGIVAVVMIVAGTRAKGRSKARAEVGGTTAQPEVSASKRGAGRRSATPKAAQDDDMSEIEDILRRHGIQ